MKDIPVFTTEHGVGSLVFREVPSLGAAYVIIRASEEPEMFLEECIGFCNAVGAQHVYASGHPILEKYPFHTSILRMTCAKACIAETDVAIFPVQKEMLGKYREIYNDKVRHILNGSWMAEGDDRVIDNGSGYFVHRNGELLGIGMVEGSEIRFLAAVRQGAGKTVLQALSHAIVGDTVTLQVASTNQKAMDLYTRTGFSPVQEISKWFCVK